MRKPLLVRTLSHALTPRPHNSLSIQCVPLSTTAPDNGGGDGVLVKKVTRSNFDVASEELRERVRESDFLAIDLEMTGVTSAPWREAYEFDRSDVRYLKVKDSADKFAILQFGVCPFRWDSSKESFVAHPHNFYIFPRKELPFGGPSDEFHCQTSSVDFLAKHQFDFNTCIYEGISYLSRTQEAEALRGVSLLLDERFANSMSNEGKQLELALMRTSDILFAERMKIRFLEWRNGILRHQGVCNLEEEHSNMKTHFWTTFFKMRPAIVLKGFTSHQHMLIQMVVEKYFNDLIFIHATTHELSEQKMVVYSDSKNDRALLLAEVRNDLLQMYKTKLGCAVGFRHVVDFISSEKKLLVGHNCFLDIAHVYRKFMGPLPLLITEFASAVHKVFPHIVDTKHLLKVDPMLQRLMKRRTSLSSAFSLLCPHVPSACQGYGSSHSCIKVEVQTDVDGSFSGSKHEAGYDAFMTGCIFAQACHHLGVDFRQHSVSKELVQNEKLLKYINILYPSWNGGTVINLKTGIEVPESSLKTYRRRYPQVVYDNTVVVWGFPSKIRPTDLKQCLSKVFGASAVSSIFYVDATAALIQFSRKELATDFLLLKDHLERDDDVISILHPLSKLFECSSTCAADYETYKLLCSSPMSKTSLAEQADAMGVRWKTKIDVARLEAREDAVCNGSTGLVANDNFPSGDEGTMKVEHVSAVIKSATGNTISKRIVSPHHASCEDILNSLYASRALLGKTNC